MKKIERYKKYLINTLIASLIAAALVAVVSVIIGSFNDTTARIIWILVSVVGHALLNIALLERSEDPDSKFMLFKNVLYALIPVSLVTSILGISTVISSGLTGSLYNLFIVIALVSLHSNILWLFKESTKLINNLIKSNIMVTGLTGALMLPQIFLSDPQQDLGDYYYRILAAAAIVDATLTILILIFYKLFTQHNPKAKDILQLFTKRGGKTRVWVWVLVVFFALQILPMLIFGLASLFSSSY